MVSRGGGFSFLDDRVTRLWYVRRAVTVAALLAIILSMAGTFAYKVYKDSEEKHVAFLESIVSGVSRNMCILFVVCPVIIGRIWVRGEAVCMVKWLSLSLMIL